MIVYVKNSFWQLLICSDVALIWFYNSSGLATCFNVKVKNFAFDTSKVITNACFFYEELGHTVVHVLSV